MWEQKENKENNEQVPLLNSENPVAIYSKKQNKEEEKEKINELISFYNKVLEKINTALAEISKEKPLVTLFCDPQLAWQGYVKPNLNGKILKRFAFLLTHMAITGGLLYEGKHFENGDAQIETGVRTGSAVSGVLSSIALLASLGYLMAGFETNKEEIDKIEGAIKTKNEPTIATLAKHKELAHLIIKSKLKLTTTTGSIELTQTAKELERQKTKCSEMIDNLQKLQKGDKVKGLDVNVLYRSVNDSCLSILGYGLERLSSEEQKLKV